MPAAPMPPEEMFRLATLYDYGILDPAATPQLDRITRVAAHVMRSEVATLSLVGGERQWLKATHGGLEASTIPREASFCAHGLDSDELLVVPDATSDPRFADNPFVHEGMVRSYVGAPLIAPNGMRLGMLCAASPNEVRPPDADQLAALRDLAAMAMYEIETNRLRRTSTQSLEDAAREVERLRAVRERLERAQQSRNEFLSTLSHELRTPLHGIIGYAELIAASGTPAARVASYAGEVASAGQRMAGMVDELLMMVRAPANTDHINWQRLDLRAVAEKALRLVGGYAFKRGVQVTTAWTHDSVFVTADDARLTQVLLQVLTNAVRASGAGGRVAVTLSIDGDDEATVSVQNGGVALTASQIQQAMTPLGQPCGDGTEGTGLGLPIGRMLMERQNGVLEMTSAPGRGTEVRLRFPGGRRPADLVERAMPGWATASHLV